jgi:hypothetical protein
MTTTIIGGEKELSEALPLINKGRAYLALGKRKQGEHCMRVCGRLDCVEIIKGMADLYVAKLARMDNVAHYSAAEISDTDKEPVPKYATTPGYYDCASGELLLSSAEEAAGIWGYDLDMTETRVILVSEISR